MKVGAKYLSHMVDASGVRRPTLVNLPLWLSHLSRGPLKPDQKLFILRDHIVPKLLYGLQTPKITGKILRDANRLIKAALKRSIYLAKTTPNQFLYAGLRDGGLGLMVLRREVPRISRNRPLRLLEVDDDDQLSFVMQSPNGRLTQQTGRNFVKAVQLRTNNLPTAGLPSNPAELRRCRGGCDRVETSSMFSRHVPVTHWERIKRHDCIVKRVARHCRSRGWEVEEEPHVRHTNDTFYKPDLVEGSTIVCDVQVYWEGETPLSESWHRKEVTQ